MSRTQQKPLPHGLRALARAWGVQTSYESFDGTNAHASPEAVVAVLGVLGAGIESERDADDALRRRQEEHDRAGIEPVLVAWDGRLASLELRTRRTLRGRVAIRLQLENGEQAMIAIAPEPRPSRRGDARRWRIPLQLRLPIGYHRIEVETEGRTHEGLVIAAPRNAFAPSNERRWGVFAPLYALGSRRSWGIGDFADLERMARWTGSLGGTFLGTLPLLAAFLDEPFDPSPYAPVSRLFWNEIFLDPAAEPCGVSNAPAELRRELAAGRRTRLVDYRRTAALKRRAIEPAADAFFREGLDRSPSFRRFLGENPDARAYAAFRAAGERQRTGWPAWPERMRHGTLRSGDYDADHARWHLFAQFAADRQLADVAAAAGDGAAEIYLDLPLGVHADGFDVWQRQHLFALGCAAGAPPDPLFTGGQNWGFPPLLPEPMRRDGYRYFIESLRHHLRYARMLRLDHVMSLERLYWVPRGCAATDGVYVRYPAEELLAVLTMESRRAEAIIIGEDLGTVTPAIRRGMDRHSLRRMFVVQFEAGDEADPPLRQPPANVVASLNTHDMPPFAAYWSGADLPIQRELGLVDEKELQQKLKARARTRRALARMLRLPAAARSGDGAAFALPGLLHWLAGSSAAAVIVNLEDLWFETEPQNVPGTGPERPNWRRRLRQRIENIEGDESAGPMLRAVAARRAGPDEAREEG